MISRVFSRDFARDWGFSFLWSWDFEGEAGRMEGSSGLFMLTPSRLEYGNMQFVEFVVVPRRVCKKGSGFEAIV